MAAEASQTTATSPPPAGSGGSAIIINGEGRRKSLLFVFILGVVIIVSAVSYWLYSRNYESTDDAQISGHLNGVTSHVDGVVKVVNVEENQTVQAGQVIAELDSRDFEVALEQAQAQLLKAEADLRAGNPVVTVTQTTSKTDITSSQADAVGAQASLAAAEHDYASALARQQEAEANNAKAQADVARYRMLVDKEEVARMEYEQIATTAKASAAAADSSRASADAAQKVVEQRRALLDQSRSRMSQVAVSAPNQILISRANQAALEAQVKATQAMVDQAKLDLSYCKIVALAGGIVTKRSVDVGEHVSKGQRLATVADLGDLWVTANFKENQLSRMRIGQSVKISVDAFGRTLDGVVQAMPGATGSVSSLLPPENASGNYVKVVQRLPVRIQLKPGQQGLDLLRPGMSVVPTVSLD
jgi:membrane fusion protein (multidrug efflux system)